MNALASGDPADGSETATVTDSISCPAGFTCTRIGTTTFPLTVAVADGSFRKIGGSNRITNDSACRDPVTLANSAALTPNGGSRLGETGTTDATVSLPPCPEIEPPTILVPSTRGP